MFAINFKFNFKNYPAINKQIRMKRDRRRNPPISPKENYHMWFFHKLYKINFKFHVTLVFVNKKRPTKALQPKAKPKTIGNNTNSSHPHRKWFNTTTHIWTRATSPPTIYVIYFPFRLKSNLQQKWAVPLPLTIFYKHLIMP